MSKIITTHITVSAPVEDVWETVTDLAGYRTWNPFITAAAGTISVGERRIKARRPRLAPPPA